MSANWVRGAYNGSKDDLNSSRPYRQHFDLGLSSRPLGKIRPAHPSALGVNLYVQQLGGVEAAPPQTSTGSLGGCRGCGCADCAQRTGDVGSYVNADGSANTAQIAADGQGAIQKEIDSSDAGRRIDATAQKALDTLKDAGEGGAAGTAIGTLIFPGVGSVVGGAIGTAAGAVYGAIDNFGGDVVDAFKAGPHWSEDQYETMRTSCRNSGGVSVAGRPPNNLDSCQYPDGSLSGGDNPVWAGQAEYEADLATRAANLGQLSSYIDGLKRIDVMIAKADLSVRQALKHSAAEAMATRNTWMRTIGKAFGTIYNATKQEGAAPANVAGFLADISPRVYMPPSYKINATAKQASSAASRALAVMHRADAISKQPATMAQLAGRLASAHIPPMISKTVGAAMSGNQDAAVAVRNTVDAARSGDAVAINDARLMSHAQRIIVLHSFVVYYGVQ